MAHAPSVTPPETSTLVDGTTMFQSPDERIRMRVDALDVHPADRDLILETIQRLVWKQLCENLCATKQTELQVTCIEYSLGSQGMRYLTSGIAGGAQVSLKLAGRVDGKPVDETITANRRFGILGGSSADMASSALQACCAGLLSAIYGACGDSETNFARIWRGIQIFKWSATAAVLVLYLAITLSNPHPVGNRGIGIDDPGSRRNELIFGAFLAALGTYALVAMGAMLIAPRQFFETDPRGIHARLRIGIQNIWGMRITAFVLAAFGFLILWNSIQYYRNS
jgi:hypothetical protein